MALKPEEIEMANQAINNNPTAGWIGALIALLIPIALGLRRWLSSDAVAREGNNVHKSLLGTLMDQLQAANERADRFAFERNEAIKEIGELKAQVAKLQATIEHMQERLCQLIPEEGGDESL